MIMYLKKINKFNLISNKFQNKNKINPKIIYKYIFY